jgi:hypothetical protein
VAARGRAILAGLTTAKRAAERFSAVILGAVTSRGETVGGLVGARDVDGATVTASVPLDVFPAASVAVTPTV